MDQLSQIISTFSIQAGVFYTGKLCGLSSFESEAIEGHIHILKSGRLSISGIGQQELTITEPSIIFFPRPKSHRLLANESDQAQVTCATVQYGVGQVSPVAQALPEVLVLPLSQAPQLMTNLDWILNEALQQQQGGQAIMNRLMEIFIVAMLRFLIEENKIEQGMLAGMAHAQLAKVLTALHTSPALNWSLDEMAELALMSRAKFSPLFKSVIGQTPNDYLTSWRVGLAQQLLLDDKPVGLVAHSVGYDSPSTLSRAFQKHCQMSPKAWLKRIKG